MKMLPDGDDLRRDLLSRDDDGDLRRRRWITGLSLVGLGAMGAVLLRQIGVIRHLPDPPIEGFDSDKVNTSETAYRFGAPDGAWGALGFAANLPLAAWGGCDRGRALPVLAASKAVVDAAISGWFFYQMPTKEKAWCGYCIAAAAASVAIAALSLPEALRALDGERTSPDDHKGDPLLREREMEEILQ